MRIAIDHRTRYAFSEPQARLVQMLRMSPLDTHDQTVINWRIEVDCDARLRIGTDGFGNKVTMLYADGPLDEIEIAVCGEVLTSDSAGGWLLDGTTEPFPPALYLRGTDRTRADPAIAAFAAGAAGDATGDAALLRIAAALRDRFDLHPGRPDDGQSAGEAFAADIATARDMAHMLIVAAHGLGMPARYIVGYHLGSAIDSEPTPHGWVEVYVERKGWLAIDPSRGRVIDDGYVRVAMGLDAADAAPVAGTRLGDGAERLDVDLHVDRVGVEE